MRPLAHAAVKEDELRIGGGVEERMSSHVSFGADAAGVKARGSLLRGGDPTTNSGGVRDGS